MSTPTYTPEYSAGAIPCLICEEPLVIRLAHGRKSKKPFIMLVCPRDGRHIRAFVNDQTYVREVLARLEGQTHQVGPARAERPPADVHLDSGPSGHSGANLERGTRPFPPEGDAP